LAKTELPRQPAPATRDELRTAIAQESSLPIRNVLIIAWYAAARVGDVLSLRRGDVALTADCKLQITYRMHKTIAHKGPYSVTTAPLREIDAQLVRRWLQQREDCHFLFPSPKTLSPAVRAALRRSNQTLELRSLRRGSLLDMAARGVAEATMLEFSGHTSSAMLRRYLTWGVAVQHVAQKTATAGAQLA
jgi:integrase